MTRCILLFALAGLTSAGCSTMSQTEKGAGIGGALGAATGLAIGAATHNPKTGAAVGALAGAGVGGLIGNEADRADKEKADARAASVAQAQATAQAQAQLGMMDVVKLSQQGVDPDVIVEQIRSTGSTFQLATSDIEYLTQCQVNARVIRAMQAARPGATVIRRQRPIVVHEPVYVAGPPVYYAPPPPSFGFSYARIR